MPRKIRIEQPNVAVGKGLYGVGDEITLSDADYAALLDAGAIAKGLISDQGDVPTDVQALAAGAPANLDTFAEVATALGTKATSAQGTKADTALQPALYVPYSPEERRYAGPTTADVSAIATGIASDATFNESYVISGNALPTNWPVDCFGSVSVVSNNWTAKTSQSGTATVASYRMMCDANEVLLFMYSAPFTFDLFVDGRPYASNPVSPVATAGYGAYGFQKITFTSAKPRLLEFRGMSGFSALYVKKPYRLWKPTPDANPSIAVVGDSWVAPTIMSDTAAGNAGGDTYLPGIYQRMAALLGITKMTSDGIASTGYLAGGGSSLPYSHSSRHAWVQALNPDVLIVHGGGVNDLSNGAYTVAATQQAMIDYFTWAHGALPNAKLVFMEGQYIPLSTYSSHVADFITLRQNVQSSLAAAGVPAYFIDVVTTRAPINGTGYVTAANSSGNSDIYIGSDQAHPTVKGHQYLRHWLAPKVAKVLADDGSLVGSLIT